MHSILYCNHTPNGVARDSNCFLRFFLYIMIVLTSQWFFIKWGFIAFHSNHKSQPIVGPSGTISIVAKIRDLHPVGTTSVPYSFHNNLSSCH